MCSSAHTVNQRKADLPCIGKQSQRLTSAHEATVPSAVPYDHEHGMVLIVFLACDMQVGAGQGLSSPVSRSRWVHEQRCLARATAAPVQ